MTSITGNTVTVKYLGPTECFRLKESAYRHKKGTEVR